MKILLYAPQDFQNICTIARSLECFGIQDCFVYDQNNLIRERYGKSYSRRSRSISAGAFEKIRFLKINDPVDFITNYTGNTIATILDEGAHSLVNFGFQTNDLVVFGAESSGLPKEISKICNTQLYIPQAGITQSLNLSHAVSLVVYENIRNTLIRR